MFGLKITMKGIGSWWLVVEHILKGLRGWVVAKRRQDGRDGHIVFAPGMLVGISWSCFRFNFIDG